MRGVEFDAHARTRTRRFSRFFVRDWDGLVVLVFGGGNTSVVGLGEGEGGRDGPVRVAVCFGESAGRFGSRVRVARRAGGETRPRAGANAGAGRGRAPNPDVGVSGRARGDGTGTTRAGDGRTSSSSDFSRMRSSRSLCVSRSCFLSAACARAREGVVRIHRRARVAERLGIEFRARAVVVLGAVRAAHGATRRSETEASCRGGRRGEAVRRRPVREGVWQGRGEGSQRTAAVSLFSERATTRDDDDPKRGTEGGFPSRSRRSRARLVAPSSERTARVTRRRLRRARTPVELVPRRAGHHAAQEEEG